jgi:hypothetical protein
MNTIAEAQFWRQIHDVEDDQPDDFFYRVDSLMGVRTIRRDTLLRPRRWDTSDRHPHVDLLAADAQRAPHQAIFRLSFWRALKDGFQDRRTRSSQHAMVLMRVPRRTVHSSLPGWTFAEDDHLSGRAELIWKLGEDDEERDGFHIGGVALEHFEVFDLGTGRWEPWNESEATLPDSVRLAAVGWYPIAIATNQGGAGMAYWHVAPESPHRPADCPYWCLVTLDENMPGTLGGEDAALARIMSYLMPGPLRELASHLRGVLTVTPTRDRVWTEQFAVSWLLDSAPWSAFFRAKPAPRLILNGSTLLCQQDVARLIRDSGLIAARREYKRSFS